jgi:hypothetical protein
MTTPPLGFAQFLRIARSNARGTTIAQLRATNLEARGERSRTQRICVVDGGNIEQKALQRRIRSVRHRLLHQAPGDLLRLVLKNFEHSFG